MNKAALAVAPSPRQTDPDPPTAEEAAAILAEAWSVDPDWGLLLWLTMVTGPRRGEISAMRWKHLDPERGLLLIQRSNAQPKRGLKEKETKTRQQRRVALDPQTLQLLTVDGARSAALLSVARSRRVADDPLLHPPPEAGAPRVLASSPASYQGFCVVAHISGDRRAPWFVPRLIPRLPSSADQFEALVLGEVGEVLEVEGEGGERQLARQAAGGDPGVVRRARAAAQLGVGR